MVTSQTSVHVFHEPRVRVVIREWPAISGVGEYVTLTIESVDFYLTPAQLAALTDTLAQYHALTPPTVIDTVAA